MKRGLLVCLLMLGFLFGYSQQDTIAKRKPGPTDIPNTNLRITPPAYFRAVSEINGFIHPGTSSSITATQVEGTSYLQVAEGLTSEYFKSQGVTLISSENVKTASGMDGMLFIVGFSVASKDSSQKVMQYERLMLFTGDYHRTAWVTANYPVMVKKVIYNVLRESILTVEFKNNND